MIVRTLLVLSIALGLAACDDMAGSGNSDTEQAQTGGTPMPAGLTRDEQVIWNSLSEAAKVQAAEFIANGGTLTQFVAI